MTLNAPEGQRVVGFTVQPLSRKAPGATSGGPIARRLM
jgi:hypothetical protein